MQVVLLTRSATDIKLHTLSAFFCQHTRMLACSCEGISTACSHDLARRKRLRHVTTSKASNQPLKFCTLVSLTCPNAIANIHTVPKSWCSDTLDKITIRYRIKYAQCVFFIGTHACERVAVKESVIIWCIKAPS